MIIFIAITFISQLIFSNHLGREQRKLFLRQGVFMNSINILVVDDEIVNL